MAGYIWAVGKFLFKQNAGVYGADVTPDVYIPLIERPDLSSVGNTYFPKDNMKQGVYSEQGIVGHESESTLGLSHYLHGWSINTPTTGPVAVHPDAELAALAFGAYKQWDSAAGAANVAGSGDALEESTGIPTKTTITMLNEPQTTGFVSGEGLMIQTTGGYEAGVIKEVEAPAGAKTITLRAELSAAAPGADATVFTGTTVYPAIAFGLKDIGATIQGQAANDLIKLLGGRPTSYKITANPRDFARAELEFMFNTAARPSGGAAPTLTTYAYPARQEVMGGCLVLWDGTDRIELDCSSFEFDLGLEVVQPLDPCGAQGAGDPILVNRTPRITINPLYTTDVMDGSGAGDNKFDPAAAFDAGTSYDIRYYWGTPGKAVLISAAACRLVEYPQPADRDNLTAFPLVFECQAYTGDLGSGAATDSDFCICFL